MPSITSSSSALVRRAVLLPPPIDVGTGGVVNDVKSARLLVGGCNESDCTVVELVVAPSRVQSMLTAKFEHAAI